MNKPILILDSEIPDYPIEIIQDAPSQGRFDDYADEIVENYEIQADHDFILDYLQEVGCWDESDLKDRDENILRFLWVTILNQKEDGGNI
jgi:hypothetical protein